VAESHNPAPQWGTLRNPSRQTLGPAVGKVMAAFKNPRMPWQRDFLDVACEIDHATGLYWYTKVILILPRQGGKTSTSRGKVVHRALTTPNARVLYTAQDRNKALKRLEENFWLPIQDSPLKAFMGKPRWQAGSEALKWKTGGKLSIDAISKKTGHGDTLHEAHIDEAYAHRDNTIEGGIGPTMATVPGAQRWVTSAAGTLESTYLLSQRDMGRALVESKRESRTLYWEFSAPEEEDPFDPATALMAHPAITHTISLDFVMNELTTDPDPDEVQRAYLGWWPKPKAAPRVIPSAGWEQNYVQNEEQETWNGTPFWAIDTSPDRETTSIALAARSIDPDAACYVELYESQPGTAGVVATMKKLRADFGGNIIALDGNGAAKSLRKDLEDEDFEVILVPGPARIDACSGFHDDALVGKLRFINDPDLNTSMGNAVKQYVGGRTWIFARNKTLADISGLYAVTFARWLFKEKAGEEYDVGDSLG
jgi:phage terminase large subunit-like protein